jgi:hypothetical protein
VTESAAASVAPKPASVSTAAQRPILDEPVIILTGARSGSTLLRLILDAHPDLACPAETNIIKACRQLASAFATIHGVTDVEQASQESRGPIDSAIYALFSNYLERRGKLRWCDKSLGTAQMARWFVNLYPKTKFICLYRHCMDVISSGLEASPWGLMGYGFEEFVALSSGNSLSALAAYWIEHTGRILDFERDNKERCLRVHYEQLVESPEMVARDVFAFLGVTPVPGITEHCLGIQPGADGPGDHKIRATRKITADSVGRGIVIPVSMIPVPQIQVMNYLLGELGYVLVDDTWQKSACPPELLPHNGSANGSAGAESCSATSFGERFAQSVLANIGDVFRARAHAGLARIAHAGAGAWAGPDVCSSFVLVAYVRDSYHLASSWRIDLNRQEITQMPGDGKDPYQADWLVTGDAETWLTVTAAVVRCDHGVVSA